MYFHHVVIGISVTEFIINIIITDDDLEKFHNYFLACSRSLPYSSSSSKSHSMLNQLKATEVKFNHYNNSISIYLHSTATICTYFLPTRHYFIPQPLDCKTLSNLLYSSMYPNFPSSRHIGDQKALARRREEWEETLQ